MAQRIFSILFLACTFMCTTGTQAQYITTFAGIGFTTGYAGDGGPATAATMYSPSDAVFDAIGNLYITDFINNVIRKVDTNGIIYTVAGTGFGAGAAGAGGYSGDNGPATDAKLNGPFALALDASGNIIFADGYNHVVRKVSTSGIITTIAGTPSAGYSGDNGPATAAELNNPVGIAIDKTGNIFIADDHNNVIRKVNTSGIITTVVGSFSAGFSGDGGPATAAELDLPIGIAFDTAQNLYIADMHNNKIRKVTTTGIISTVAGADTAGYMGDGGPATAARLDSAQRINFDDANNMYVSDFFNNVVRKVDAATQIITTVAGNGFGAGSTPAVGSYDGDDSLAVNAGMYLPFGVAFDKQHRMYICDRGNDVIRRVGPKPIDHTGTHNTTSAASTLTIYPNPSNGRFTINLTSVANENVEMVVTNILGEPIQKVNTISNVPYTLMLSQPAGIYLLSATTASGKWMKRIVVQ